MDLYKEILIEMILHEQTEPSFTHLQVDFEKALNSKCYKALNQIKSIIDDDSLDDRDCHKQIEEIVNLFVKLGCDCSGRHCSD